MGKRILDPKLMQKLAKKLNKKNVTDVNKVVSRKASNLAISSEAALVLLAKEHGIGTATYQKGLDPRKQAEITNVMAVAKKAAIAAPISKTAVHKAIPSSQSDIAPKTHPKLVLEYLISDTELLDRCNDILLGKKNFDRAINQATLVLEERIRKKSAPSTKLVGENLVNYAFKEDINQTVLRVNSKDSEAQRGFTQILRGVVPAFRNRTHHHIIENISREDAIRICGFIDALLREVDACEKIK